MLEKYTKKLGLALLLVFFATHLSGCKAAAGMQPSQATSTQFLTQLKAGQPAAAYALLTAPCKAATTQPQMQSYWDLIEKNDGKVQSWTQQFVSVNSGFGSMGSNVQLTYQLKCAKGNAGITFVCVEENNKWLIQSFNFQL